MQVAFTPLAVGDQKPIALCVRPDDLNGHAPGTVVSGSWSLVDSTTGNPAAGVAPNNGSIDVDARPGPSFIRTGSVSWNAMGTYICRFQLLWDDGEVDNTLSARIIVIGD